MARSLYFRDFESADYHLVADAEVVRRQCDPAVKFRFPLEIKLGECFIDRHLAENSLMSLTYRDDRHRDRHYFVSLCGTCFLHHRQYFFSSIRSGCVRLFFVVE